MMHGSMNIKIMDLLTSIVPFSMGMHQAVRCSSKFLRFDSLKGPDGNLYAHPQSFSPQYPNSILKLSTTTFIQITISSDS